MFSIRTKLSEADRTQSSLEDTTRASPQLPKQFHGELNFSRRGCGRGQLTSNARGRASRIEDISIVWRDRHGKVGVVQHVEELGAELHVEVLRDFSNTIVLEDRKVQIGQTWSDQDITPGVTTKVKTLRIRNAYRITSRVRIGGGVTVSSPKGLVGRRRNGELRNGVTPCER